MGEMTVANKPQGIQLSTAEQALICGNLADLDDVQRLDLYGRICDSLHLNPLTKPFEYIILNDKLTLYARRDCTDQLRRLHNVSVTIADRQLVDGVYTVTARATLPDGRSDESIGAVALVKEGGSWETAQSGKKFFKGSGQFNPLNPDDRANKIMTAETKAKRRVTLSICGLGFLDETEIDSLRTTGVAADTGDGKQAAQATYTKEEAAKIQADFKLRCDSMGYEGKQSELLAKLLGMSVADVKAVKGSPGYELIDRANKLGPDAWNTAIDSLTPVAEAAPTEEVKAAA